MKLRNIWKARQKKRGQNKVKPPFQEVLVEPLEPRVLLSADAISAVMPVDAPDQDGQQEQGQIDEALGNVELPGQSLELVFVDIKVEGYEKIVADLTAQTDRNFDIHIIDGEGFNQVTNALGDADNVSAVHIISHGDPGVIEFGDQRLDIESLSSVESELLTWADALTAEADILFYGCDVAASAAGVSLLEQIATLTGADVAASNDLTGAGQLGGDWDLEVEQGVIETNLAISSAVQKSYHTTLDITSDLVIHLNFDSNANDASGNNRDGTFVNGAGIDGSDFTVGTGSLQTDGTNDYVDLDDHEEDFADLSEGTIAAWIKTSSTAQQAITELSDSGGTPYAILEVAGGGNLRWFFTSGTVVEVESTTPINDGLWHHVALTVDSSGTSLYLDGAELTGGEILFTSGSSASTEFYSDLASTEIYRVGAANTGGGAPLWEFDGNIDEFRVYSRALSAGDIGQLVALGSPDLVVDTAADYNSSHANYGDTSSVAALNANKGADGLISLREAIDAANNQGGHDTITFNIPGSGTQVITLSSLLPNITDGVTIDGTTQTDWLAGSFNPIVIDGNNLAGDGLFFSGAADGSEVRGLVIRDFADEAIEVEVGADNVTIAGNFLGAFDSSGFYVAGEELGGASLVVSGDNAIIGGTSLADRNVLAGSTNGIVMNGASGGTVSGNYIGTDVTGNTIVTTTLDGVRLENGANNITVGGITAAHRNVIAGVGADGVEIDGPTSSNNQILNNYIGVSANGLSNFGTAATGILITGGADLSTISDNWIAGSGAEGIDIDGASSFTTIQGNRIGTDATGTVDWGTVEAGIKLESGTNATTIGGFAVGDSNVVAYSGTAGSNRPGIQVESGNTSASIRGNQIYANDGLGIDLSAGVSFDGVTFNDAGDGDSGGNALQNFPVLSAVSVSDAGTMSYTIDTSSFAPGTYEIDFYASTDRDNGQVEGARFLGSGGFVPWGNASFNGVMGSVTLAPGEFVVASVTDATGNTSEFSNYAVATDNDGSAGVTLTAPSALQGTVTIDGGLRIN
ncbi:MAG: DUF4347 domain-containing protein, partial [Pseudomonadota bacterium]